MRTRLSTADRALQRHLDIARRALHEAMTLCTRTARLRAGEDDNHQFVGGPKARDAAALLRRAVKDLDGVGTLMQETPEQIRERARMTRRSLPLAVVAPEEDD